MTYHPAILVDTGLLVAFYDSADQHHGQVVEFFSSCTSRLVTTVNCVTEVVWLHGFDWRVQNEFLTHLANNIYECESLLLQDFARFDLDYPITM
ncbi:hypothetical protein [Moorena producens]|uniref:hypothetical protein n=1 Tax=Moorena producens TaxID=1155739 RepID=UPI000A702755|nr:hypothetical protein [Moorena producens]